MALMCFAWSFHCDNATPLTDCRKPHQVKALVNFDRDRSSVQCAAPACCCATKSFGRIKTTAKSAPTKASTPLTTKRSLSAPVKLVWRACTTCSRSAGGVLAITRVASPSFTKVTTWLRLSALMLDVDVPPTWAREG